MSDPVKNADIEDVLSSIRRLVSEDARPRARVVEPPAPERLVLTPALRIDPDREAAAPEPTQEAAQAGPEAQDQDEHHDHGETAGDAEPEAWDGANEEAQPEEGAQPVEDARPVEDVPNTADTEDQPEPTPAETWEEAEEAARQEAEPQEERAAVTPEEPEPAAEAPDAHEAVFELLDALAHEDQALPEAATQPEAEHVPSAEQTPIEAGDVSFDDEALAWEDHLEVPPEEGDADQSVQTDEPAAPRVASLDDAAEDRLERSAHDTAWETETRDDAIDAAAMAAGAAAADLLSEETVLDEETLREMVAEIVRQELQGALGERITRNVRKLVRREIHRALSSHEFE